ncbi:MAG: flagellar M-ring protein FliF [Spirochaetaceae bacterium]|jgi:flagellar M-ring protein FliF|nr:flagellar M-ring protein FliF [Spirochaetaceae bacterium]
MPEFLRKFFDQLKAMWSKWSLIQRLVLVGITVAVIGAMVALVSISSTPGLVPVITTPITDEAERARIVTRIDAEGIKVSVSSSGVISVGDEASARRMRAILIREGLVPQGTDPWALFDRERWTITDWERNVNLRRAITATITEHIKALPEIDDANVIIVQPEKTLFSSQQDPVTASVILTPKPGSDITTNRKKIEGIQKILKHAVQGLLDENITIVDQDGLTLNDFEGMKEFDRLANYEKELKIQRDWESKYRADVLRALQSLFSADRVRDLNVKVAMNMSKKSVEGTSINPIILKPRSPGSVYDDSQFIEKSSVSEVTTKTSFEGTGFNPEGPPGVEGTTPPAFKDMQNLFGKVNQETVTRNYEHNKEKYSEERSPTIDRVSVSVNIDGIWQKKYNESGDIIFRPDGGVEREYSPISENDLAKARELVEGAIGYSAARGDTVIVQNIQIDRSVQFASEDRTLLRQRQIQITVIASLIGIAVLLIGFVVYHIVSRAREQARRRREEELARQHQLMREQALLDADKEGQDVSLSVEDQARLELLEKSMNMAREHPADVSQLIRTWLLEE